MTGKIKKIVEGKPFGFISIEGQSHDVFFHQDKLVGVSLSDLKPGDEVSFQTEESVGKNGEKRVNAIDIKRT